MKDTLRVLCVLSIVFVALWVVYNPDNYVAAPMPQTTVRPVKMVPIDAFKFTYATGATNQVKITVQALSANLVPVSGANFEFWISETSDGAGPSRTAGGATAGQQAQLQILGSVGGFRLATTQAVGVENVLTVWANSSGNVQFGLFDANKGLNYPTAHAVSTRVRAVGPRLTAANYAMLPFLPTEIERFLPFMKREIVTEQIVQALPVEPVFLPEEVLYGMNNRQIRLSRLKE